ncbi:MAG: helix-turn-helix transcriptional regulator [Magnetococcales bacterium]|nr:helix-turn-helix transcriptional regulator [Magnetococcales bacterium]
MKCETNFIENSEKLLKLFKALGDKSRLNIFKYFCQCSLDGTQENSVNNIKSCCDIDLSVVSRHLAALKKAGVLNAKKEGKNVFYSLNAKGIATTLRELADSIESCCSDNTKNHKEKP